MRAVLLGVGVAAALVTGEARPAAACTCVPGWIAHPAGAEVPRSTIIIWSALGSEAPILRRAGGGDEIPLELDERRYANYDAPVWFGRPAALLDAGASYEICALVAGSETCSPFAVGSAVDEVAPVIAPPTALHAQRLRNIDGSCDSRCWGSPSDALILDHEPASEAGYAVIEVRREQYQELSWSFLIGLRETDARTLVFNGLCSPSLLSLQEGVVYCSRMTAMDGSGNLSAPTAEMCGEATTCETERCENSFDGTCPALSRPDAGVSDPAPEESGGCALSATAAGPGGAWLGLLALAALRSRRRPRTADRSTPDPTPA